MGTKKRTKAKAEFGDFQTPTALATAVCLRLRADGLNPASFFEPTCGEGSFLKASLEVFPAVRKAVGLEISKVHLSRAKKDLPDWVKLVHQDFFALQWVSLLDELPEPILVDGNPPWVTSADLRVLDSGNLPQKSNFQKHSGMDAITGKSNFDVSEWMLIHLAEALQGRRATLAILCKSAVARKTLTHCWKNGIELSKASICEIDAKEHFDANVGACLLIAEFGRSALSKKTCDVFSSLSATQPTQTIGYQNDVLIADIRRYEHVQHLESSEDTLEWRSGIKHDCSKVMELVLEGSTLKNGLGDIVTLEPTYLYPMLKSSDVAHGRCVSKRFMIVTQTFVGESTDNIERVAPKTWQYLKAHEAFLGGRSSSIYKGKPPFSIFGVGPYSFSTWKVAISGLYPKLKFTVLGPHQSRPVVLDDTCYFTPCATEDEARVLADALNGPLAMEFLESLIFLDNKRPVTVDLLRRLDKAELAGSCRGGVARMTI